jgi:putative sterol carrier protein
MRARGAGGRPAARRPDFLRIGTGAMSPTMGIIEGHIVIEGDVVLAARIPYLFGIGDD